MRKNTASQSGVLNPRVLVAFALCSVGVGLAMLSFAATPPSGMIGSPTNSPGDSLFVGQHAGPLSGKTKTAPVSKPLAPAATGDWSIVASPNASASQKNYLTGVTCVSASDCWAVGYYNTGFANQTLIERWNGTSWSIVTSPNTSTAQSNYLFGVTCGSASDCWAVGYYSAAGAYQTLIERWDGTSWVIVTSPNALATRDSYLTDVTCASASDCWAVGSSYDGSVYQTLIERWNGVLWTIAVSPDTSGTAFNLLHAVACASASDCWAVGYYDNVFANQTLIERWNGVLWAIVTSPNINPTQPSVLNGVTCVSASNCWAVGYYYVSGGKQHTLIERWDGMSWAIVTSPNTSATQDNLLFGVTCTSASDCWAAGYYDNDGNYQTLIERWDGTSWSIVTSPNTNPTKTNELYGVTCTLASCWAVGDYVNASGVNQTLTERYTLPPVQLISVVSSKIHGSADTFDVDLALDGSGIECRSGGANGDYTLVLTFASTLTSVGGAAVSSGTGSVSGSAFGPDPNQFTVNLTGVSNAQVLIVSLADVYDSAGNYSSSVSASMGVLVGDVNASGIVTSGDTNLCKAQALQPVTNANFRNDINASGSITTGDVNIIKQNALSHLPSPP